MASLLDHYEQQYSNVTAEITSKVGIIRNLSKDEKKKYVIQVDKHLEDAKELLEQMELECHEIPSAERNKYQSRVDGYTAELKNLEKELRVSLTYNTDSAAREELLSYVDDMHHGEDQRQRLLDNTERVERSGRYLTDGYRMCVESEEAGAAALGSLRDQRDTLTRARNRVLETDETLGRSSKVLTAMMRRILQNRCVLYIMVTIFVAAIALVIYLSVRKHGSGGDDGS